MSLRVRANTSPSSLFPSSLHLWGTPTPALTPSTSLLRPPSLNSGVTLTSLSLSFLLCKMGASCLLNRGDEKDGKSLE